MEREQVESIELEIRSLIGVDSARLRLDDQGAIAEVHVVALPGRQAESVVREVLTTLFARYGIELARERVSVAAKQPLQLVTESTSEDAPRVQFKSVNIFRENQRVESRVELTRGDRVLIGTATGPAIRRSGPRLVGKATLIAIGQLLPVGVAWALVEVERRRVGGRAALLCHVVLLRGRRETHLVGSVFQAGDPLEATVLAVLDATNRILPVLEGEDAIEYEVEPFVARSRS